MPALLVMPSIQGLMPVYAAEVFHVDSKGLGLLMSAVGAGSTLGTFVLASKGDIGSKNVVVLVSISVLTLATAVFSINVFFHTAYLNLMVISAAMMTFFSVSNAVIQSTVSDEYRGRVAGLYILTWGLFPFGSLSAGFLAERLGRASCHPDCGRNNAASVRAGGLEDQGAETPWMTRLCVHPCLYPIQFRIQTSRGHRLLVATDALRPCRCLRRRLDTPCGL